MAKKKRNWVLFWTAAGVIVSAVIGVLQLFVQKPDLQYSNTNNGEGSFTINGDVGQIVTGSADDQDEAKEKNSKPMVFMGVRSDKGDPFDAIFYVKNKENEPVENVVVSIADFDYFNYEGSSLLATDLSRSNLTRIIGFIEPEESRNIRIIDLVSYGGNGATLFRSDDSSYHQMLDGVGVSKEAGKIFSLPKSEKENLRTTLLCFKISYSFNDSKYYTHSGFLIDNEEDGFDYWVARSYFCDPGYIKKRRKKFSEIKNNYKD